MSDKYHVRISSLKTAAGGLEANLSRFEEATQQANQAARELADMWEGDMKEAFVQEQAECTELYTAMQNAVRSIVQMVQSVASRYQATDIACAKLFQK